MSSSKQSKHNTDALQDRIAIVTGSDSGISQETARILAQSGCHVVICYHSDEKSTKETAKLVEVAGHQDSASKAELHDLTRGMAFEVAQYGVRVCGIGPGLI
ncbi:unnamed protein product [Rotaria sp. Silwood1]|nr:unnamed protein product [Rotaria sp. Silwood1]